MGALEWWNNRVFDVMDIFTTSHVEDMRNSYRNLVNYLNRKLPDLNNKITALLGTTRSLSPFP